jgi:hypothetical protein
MVLSARRAHRSRAARHVARGAVPFILLAQLVVTAPPAHASATPWRFFGTVTNNFSVPAQSIGGGTVFCPASYIPVGGGLTSVSAPDSFERVAEFREGTLGYRVVIHNYATNAISMTLAVRCALAAHVGTLLKVSQSFAQNGTLAGGAVSCPEGQVAIVGGADWSTVGVTNNRRIDLTSPTADGRGWYATGESPIAATLDVEAYCASAADVGVTPRVVQQDVGATSEQVGQHACPSGQRDGSAGVLASAAGSAPDPYTYRASTIYSAPAGPNGWSSKTYVLGGTRLSFVTWCFPASVPAVTFTQSPPAFSPSSDATFTVSASDPTGEAISQSCHLDGNFQSTISCPNDTPVTLHNLADGPHTFAVDVRNASSQAVSKTRSWTVDTVGPTATGPPGVVSVGGSLKVTFSEPVTGVSASSVQLRVTGQSAAVPGRVTLGSGATAASWTPSSPLVPGERYRLSVTSAIKDRAGHPLAAPVFDVRASGSVQNTSPALREYWDRDSHSSASGGTYAVSNAALSHLTWRVSAAAGQTAAIYGVRQRTGGYGEVWVDGVKKGTASFYAASTVYNVKVFTTSALSAGTHTVQVRVPGTKPAASSGTFVALDYLALGSTFVQETGATGAFRRLSASAASGGSYDVVGHTTTGDNGTLPSYAMTFRGTGVKVYVTRWTGAGPARMYIDGVLKATVNLTRSSTAYRQLAYSASGLTDARHTISIVAAGTSTGSASGVAVDCLAVT